MAAQNQINSFHLICFFFLPYTTNKQSDSQKMFTHFLLKSISKVIKCTASMIKINSHQCP